MLSSFKLFQDALGAAPSSGLTTAQSDPQTHTVAHKARRTLGAHKSHRITEMKGTSMRFIPSPVSKTQTAVTHLLCQVTLYQREQTTNPQPQTLPAVGPSRHMGVC